ncbi:MAG TPA: ATP-dependent helicase, partial [Verrucomicrobiae bacterium]|nr:ATP-dependent helicase [Verrucomicrobiae bacterium]
MPKLGTKNGRGARFPSTTKYDAHHTVLSKTYGALADLRRELADSKERVAEREELLRGFSTCTDSQRAWLLLEDYFEKLSLSRKDFNNPEWWPRLMAVLGKPRLEEVAILFLRANRPLPTELQPHANVARFAEIEQAEQEQKVLDQIENWMFPPAPEHLDSPRASLRAVCHAQPSSDHPSLHYLAVRFSLFRPRTGEKVRPLSELLELTTRSAHEQELFPPEDWEFIRWLAETYPTRMDEGDTLRLSGLELLQWLARWGNARRLEFDSEYLQFHGQVVDLQPDLENGESGHTELSFTQRLAFPDGKLQPLDGTTFFTGKPSLVLLGTTFYLLRSTPPPVVLEYWINKPSIPVQKLSHRLRTQLRRIKSNHGVDWSQLCVAHPAVPQFVFELSEDTVRLRLLACSERNQSVWKWSGQEWRPDQPNGTQCDKPEILEDPRLDLAVRWLRRLDWFTTEPGVWVGDANENFL